MPAGFASHELAEVVARLRPSVVQIAVHGRGAGAGIVWDADGGIVTNHHVVGEAEAVTAILHDGRSLSARVVRRGAKTDLALLQAPAGGLQPAPVRDSTTVRVGELVLAIGHPWGQPGVVTAGIVSGTGRAADGWGRPAIDCIRSDVELAPGNSGGPLVDAAGRVIGVNSMILGGDLSVAIPTHTVGQWLAGAVQRPFLGAALQPVEARAAAVRAAGLLITGLRPLGPAQQAGLAPGDVIVGCDGRAVGHALALRLALDARAPGDAVLLDVLRDGTIQRVVVTLGMMDGG